MSGDAGSAWRGFEGEAVQEGSGGVGVLEHGCVADTVEDLDPGVGDSAVVLGGGRLPSPVLGAEDHQGRQAEAA